jgi:hypothetical protein
VSDTLSDTIAGESGESDTGTPSSDYRFPELVICGIGYSVSRGFFRGSDNFCLIITTRRLISAKTDDIITEFRKETGERISSDFSIGPVFSGYLKKMQPDEIIAKIPHAHIIPLDDVISFAITKKNFYGSEDIVESWRTKISYRTGTIEFLTNEFPVGFLETSLLEKLLGKRFCPAEPGFLQRLFGMRNI